MKIFILGAISLFTLLLNQPKGNSIKAKKNLVPDSTTAIKIAEAIWLPIYGEILVNSEKPFLVENTDSYWIVRGSFPEKIRISSQAGERIRGGTLYIKINKVDGKIEDVWHEK